MLALNAQNHVELLLNNIQSVKIAQSRVRYTKIGLFNIDLHIYCQCFLVLKLLFRSFLNIRLIANKIIPRIG